MNTTTTTTMLEAFAALDEARARLHDAQARAEHYYQKAVAYKGGSFWYKLRLLELRLLAAQRVERAFEAREAALERLRAL